MRHTFRIVLDHPVDPGGVVRLVEADAHHLLRVARRGVGDLIELVDSDGVVWPGTIISGEPSPRVQVSGTPRASAPPLAVSLAVGLGEPKRLDLVVEKAAELGVAEVLIVVSDRARRVPSDEEFVARRERLQRVADAAARQSGRGVRTAIRGLVPFRDVVADAGFDTFLLDSRGEVAFRDALMIRGSEGCRILVGPDTGFSVDEVDAASRAGVTVCRLGLTTLRMETAAVAAGVIAAEAMGRLGVE